MHTWNVATQPIHQRPIGHGKPKPSQRRWIVLAARDKSYDICAVDLDADEDGTAQEIRIDRPYDLLWSDLGGMALGKRKWWLIGFGVRRALEGSKWMQALEDGKAHLPVSKSGDSKGQRSGRLVVSCNAIDIDLVCGTNKIKIVDYDNYGIYPKHHDITLDAQILQQSIDVLMGWLRVCALTGMSASKTTAAQTGWARMRLVKDRPALWSNADPLARDIERRAYFGGRNEPYYLGDYPGKVYSLDVKSCYAHVCATREVPIRLHREYRAGCEVSEIPTHGADHWIADAVVKTDSPDYPVQWCGSPIYPVGTFLTTLCWPELKHALMRGRVIRVLRAARYASAMALERAAEWFAAAKLAVVRNGLDAFMSPLKLAFNAGLGFTSRRHYEWMPMGRRLGNLWAVGSTRSPEDKSTMVPFHSLDGVCEWLRVAGEPRDAIPYLHATIGSWARVRLLELYDIAGKENILYVDTDGMLVNQRGMDRLAEQPGTIGNNSGQLTERFASGRCRVQGQKNYRVGDNWICSGQVRARYSALIEKSLLTTDCGRVRLDGVVEPFEFTSEPHDGEREGWVNRLA